MLRMRFKFILCIMLVLIPVSTQTGSDCILSDNWAIKREMKRLEWRMKDIQSEIDHYKQKYNIRLANMEINRNENVYTDTLGGRIEERDS